MKNKKRGQGLVEYVLLLLIPVLVISFIPNLNKTMKMTMTTVGVDLLEEMGDVEWSAPSGDVACPDDDPTCAGTVLYPPVARFELPENCGITGVYGKGRPVRLANASYDIDGDIDHLQWWIKRYDVDGDLDTACTTPQDAPIIVNRTDLTNIDAGLTISGIGYGNALIYGQRQCTRDPGSYEVTLRVIDNDGLVSQPYTLRYEIRDVRPSLTIMATSDSVSTGEYCDPHPENDDYCGGSGQIAQIRDSDSCKFYPTNGLRATDKSIDYTNSGGKGTIVYNGHSYPYLEICPYVGGSYTGEVIFKIHNARMTTTQTGANQTTETTASWAHADPDYIAINGMDYAFEGENNPDKDRHGFKYKTRYISSVQTEGTTIDPDTVQITTFETGANTYTKQFRTPGTYIYDGFVYDENEVSAFDSTVTPNAGVAVRVISQADPDYEDKCPPPPSEGGTCPKPKYMLAIEKFGGEKEGVIYTSVGVFGNNENNSKITATGNYSLSNVENWFKPVNGTAITSNNYSNTIAQLRTQAANLLDLEIYSATKQINGQNTEIAGLAPKTADRLVFHTLVYWGDNVDPYPEEGSEYAALKECIPDESGNNSQYLYWSSSSSYPNNFSLSTMKEDSSSAFTDWNGPGEWARIYRPYEDSSITSTFNGSNINRMAALPAGFATFKDVNGQTVLGDHADVLVGMARNHYGTQYSDTNLAPNPYNSSPSELLTYDMDWHRSSAIEENTYPENGYLRSNAQVIAVIPKNEMCPLHEQRPIPNLSVYAYEVDANGNLSPEKTVVLLENDLDIILDTDGMGKFNMGGKQYKIPCESGGCFIQTTAIDSSCGTGATADCKLIGTRWKFDRVVNSATQNQTDDDNIYYPHKIQVTRFNNGYTQPNNTTVQGEHTYYGTFGGSYSANTMDTTEDTIWKHPINANKMTYVYYGEYGSTEEIGNQRADTASNNPRFDFDATNPETAIAPNARNIPNTNEINQDFKPNLFVNEQSNAGYFVEAFEADDPESRPYSYELEIIDSQGCATSTRRSITVTKMVNKPIAFCNYEYHYLYDEEQIYEGNIEVPIPGSTEEPIYDNNGEIIGYDYPLDQTETDLNILKNYQYYGGKMVQSVATVDDPTQAGDNPLGYILPTILENGDIVDKYEEDKYFKGSRYTLINYPRTSPMFMFSPIYYNYVAYPNGEIPQGTFNFNRGESDVSMAYERGEDIRYFLAPVGIYENANLDEFQMASELGGLYNKDKENGNGIEQGNLYDPEYYNPRIAQILTGENLSDFINAKNTIWKDDTKIQSSDDTTLVAQWKVYPAKLKESTSSWRTHEEIMEDETLHVLTDQTSGYSNNGYQFVNVMIGQDLEKTSNTPVCTDEGPIEEGPNCQLNSQGYYIVELTVKDTMGGNDPDAISDPINCKVKVKIPKLDFKCPWGETTRELVENAFVFKEDTSNSGIITDEYGQIIENIVAQQTDVKDTFKEGAVFVGNDRINTIEITPYLYQDPNRFDLIEQYHYNDELIRFYNTSYWDKESLYRDLDLNKFDGSYAYLGDYKECTLNNQQKCQEIIQARNGSMHTFGGIGKNKISVLNTSTNKYETKELYTIQPLRLIHTTASIYDGTSCDYGSSNFNLDTCVTRDGFSYPLEIWLTKMYISRLHNKTDMSDPNSKANYEYYKYLVETTLYSYSQEEKDFALTPLEGLPTEHSQDYYKIMYALTYALDDLSPYGSIINEYFDVITEYIARSYDKSHINWINVQPYVLNTGLAGVETDGTPKYSSAFYRFYLTNIRENNLGNSSKNVPARNPSQTYGKSTEHFRTSFYGKKEAIMRFEQINYFDIKSAYEEIDPEAYPDFSAFENEINKRKIASYNIWWNKGEVNRGDGDYYYDYKTIFLNTSTTQLTPNWEPVKSTISNNEFLANINPTGISYWGIPDESLNLNTVLKNGYQTAKTITDQTVIYSPYRDSRIVYLKVNVSSRGTEYANDRVTYALPAGGSISVDNSYSKLCPIVVRKDPEEISNEICFLRSKNMSDPEASSGLEKKNGYIYLKDIYSGTDFASGGYVSVLPYQYTNSENILTFGAVGDSPNDYGVINDNVYPTFTLDGIFTDVISQARAKDAIYMDISFDMEGRNYGSVSLNISGANKYAPTYDQLQIIKNQFDTAIRSTSFNINSIEPTIPIADNEEKLFLLGKIPTTESQCNAKTFNGYSWSQYYNYYTDDIATEDLTFTYEAPNCIINKKVSGQDPHYGLHLLTYTISFRGENNAPIEIKDTPDNKKTCNFWTAHQIAHKKVEPVSARIWLGKVYDRIQYLSEPAIPHSDYSVNRYGKRYKGNGVYAAGTTCTWEISPSGFYYKNARRNYEDSATKNTTRYGGDGHPYIYAYDDGKTRVQEEPYCDPRIDGVAIETKVDIRSLQPGKNAVDLDNTGFVVQELNIQQGTNSNQRCYSNQSGTNHRGAAVCRAATMYGVTTGKGSSGEAILGNLNGTDVFLALEKQNGGWSEVIEKGVAVGGKIWVGYYVRRN